MLEGAAPSKEVFVICVDICLGRHHGSKGSRLEGVVLSWLKTEFVQ